MGCSTIPGTQKNAKLLTLIVRKVNKNAIQKNTDIIRLYSPDSEIGGHVSVYMPRMRIWADVSAYMPRMRIWMDNYPSICKIGRYRWTAIRLCSLQGDIGRCCPSNKELECKIGAKLEW